MPRSNRMDGYGKPMDCGCYEDTGPVCDFCIHFLMFKNRDGGNIDGSGYCGLHRKKTDAGDGCEDFYCFHQFNLNQKPSESEGGEKSG